MSELTKDFIGYAITFDLVAVPFLVGLGIYLAHVYDSVYEHVYKNYNYTITDKGTEDDLAKQETQV